MTEKQIVHFMAVYETGSMGAAAEKLFVSRPAVSHSVTELEREFAVALLERYKTGVIPTYAGRLLYEMMTGISQYYKVMSEHCRNLNRVSTQRRLTLGLSAYNIHDAAIVLFTDFGRLHPEIELSLVEAKNQHLKDRLVSGELDAILWPGSDSGNPMFDSLDLFSSRLVLGVSVKNPLSQKSSLSIPDLFDKPLAVLQTAPEVSLKVLEKAFADCNRVPYYALRTSNVSLLRELTERGFVMPLIPENMIFSWEGVKPLTIDIINSVKTHRLIWCKTRAAASPLRELIAFMAEKTHGGQTGFIERPV